MELFNNLPTDVNFLIGFVLGLTILKSIIWGIYIHDSDVSVDFNNVFDEIKIEYKLISLFNILIINLVTGLFFSVGVYFIIDYVGEVGDVPFICSALSILSYIILNLYNILGTSRFLGYFYLDSYINVFIFRYSQRRLLINKLNKTYENFIKT